MKQCRNFLIIASLCYMFQVLVLAGLKDINRPAEKLSMFQSTALMATGL